MRQVVIMGAAGRDFHNFNLVYRDDPGARAVAFTAAQIPDIAGRVYPPELAGPRYPEGIPIVPEEQLDEVVAQARRHGPVEVAFSYSDVSHLYVMHRASAVGALGADFVLLGPDRTMLRARVPVVAVTAVRTGVGKSQTTRRVVELLRSGGLRVVAVRHPMPYGDLRAQVVQRFAEPADLDRHRVTIEEREEFEPLLERGVVVYAGVDYARVLEEAQAEADVLVWDGGNNDLPFFRPDLHLTLVDPHRPGHEVAYHPGETNLRRAHVVIVNKVDTAPPDGIRQVRRAVRLSNPGAVVIEAASPLFVDEPERIRGARALVVEDGPTLTHGDMPYGAGTIAAERFGAREIIDPRPYAVGSIAETFRTYPNTGAVLPAMGYTPEQVRELEETIRRAPADVVVVATPIDLRRVIRVAQPMVRVRYELQEIGIPSLGDVLGPFLERRPAREFAHPDPRPAGIPRGPRGIEAPPPAPGPAPH